MSQLQEASPQDTEEDDYDELYTSITRSDSELFDMILNHKAGTANKYLYIIQVTGSGFEPTYRHVPWGKKVSIPAM